MKGNKIDPDPAPNRIQKEGGKKKKKKGKKEKGKSKGLISLRGRGSPSPINTTILDAIMDDGGNGKCVEGCFEQDEDEDDESGFWLEGFPDDLVCEMDDGEMGGVDGENGGNRGDGGKVAKKEKRIEDFRGGRLFMERLRGEG